MTQKRKLTIAAATAAAMMSASAVARCETQLRTKAPSVEPVMELRIDRNDLDSLFDSGTGITARMIKDSISEMKESAGQVIKIKAERAEKPKETASPPKEAGATVDTAKETMKVMNVGDVLNFKDLAVEMKGVSPISLAICLSAQYGEDEWNFELTEGQSTELKAMNADMEKTYVFEVKVEKLGYNGLDLTAAVSIKLKSVN